MSGTCCNRGDTKKVSSPTNVIVAKSKSKIIPFLFMSVCFAFETTRSVTEQDKL